jgi:hypothetical protein
MSLLSEYALTPGIFFKSNFVSERFADSSFEHLHDLLLDDGIVRNLWGGRWYNETLIESGCDLHLCGQKLLKVLKTQKRLLDSPPAGSKQPVSDEEWCEESLLSHNYSKLAGIVTTIKTAKKHSRAHQLVTPIDQMTKSLWWEQRRKSKGSVCVKRTTDSYLQQLKPFLESANSLMFIDANLDPKRPSYAEFHKLLEPLCNRRSQPLVEIHRTIYERNPNKVYLSIEDWRLRFCTSLLADVSRQMNIKFEVYLWKYMHDRFFITDLMGISLPNGFDTGPGTTIWSAISRDNRDAVQREFAVEFNRSKLVGSFTI